MRTRGAPAPDGAWGRRARLGVRIRASVVGVEPRPLSPSDLNEQLARLALARFPPVGVILASPAAAQTRPSTNLARRSRSEAVTK